MNQRLVTTAAAIAGSAIADPLEETITLSQAKTLIKCMAHQQSFLLLSPPDAGADHLKALASVSRTFRDRSMLAKLRGARSRDALFALLAGEESRNAA
mgnify:CR=1 FL=1